MRRFLGFPAVVNEKAARVVAAGVAGQALLVVLAGWHWVMPIMALGFLARVAAGPRLSVLAQVATRIVAPRLGEPAWVPGPPKRFAQGVGLAFTAVGSIASFGLGQQAVATGLMVVLLGCAVLEAVVGFCVGCWAFGRLMRWGVVPQDVCESCNDIRLRRRSAVVAG